MKKAFITKLENNNSISIRKFQYLSGDSYKASFDLNKFNESKGHSVHYSVLVKSKETYQQAIDRVLNKDFETAVWESLLDAPIVHF